MVQVHWMRRAASGGIRFSAQNNGNIAEGKLICTSCGREFPVVRSMARFVPSEDYAHSLGYQWNFFDKTQLDSHMGNNLSHERFYATTQWPQKMEGQVILEAGCGMGRFTQVALETGAELFSFDLSNSVEANLRNNGDSGRVHILQASIYEIPFQEGIVRQNVLHGSSAVLSRRARRVHEPGALPEARRRNRDRRL